MTIRQRAHIRYPEYDINDIMDIITQMYDGTTDDPPPEDNDFMWLRLEQAVACMDETNAWYNAHHAG